MTSKADRTGDTETPANGPTARAGVSRSRPRAQAPRTRRNSTKPLIETTGPEPSSPLDDVRLTVGVLGAPHGVRGAIKLKLLTDHPDHLATLDTVYLGESDEPTALERIQFQGDQAIVKLAGSETPEEAKLLGGLKVRIAGRDAKPLEAGEYFLFQLIGLKAQDPSGIAIGTVTDLMETGAHDVLVISPELGADILVPNHPQFVHEISPETGTIVVTLPEYEN